MPNNDKYGGRSRGFWRKVYGYQNNKPQVVAFVDTTTNTTMSLDLNRTLRHRDYFYIDAISGNTSSLTAVTYSFFTAEYDEGLVTINNRDSGTGSFAFTFSGTPIVVLTPNSASAYTDNVIVYGLTLNTASFTFGVSAPYSGTIRYRAIYSPSGYPAVATSSYTASITASANSTNPGGVAYYTASFAALPGTPFQFLQTTWDTNNTQAADVFLETQSTTSNTATTEISSPLSSSVHYIAFYSA